MNVLLREHRRGISVALCALAEFPIGEVSDVASMHVPAMATFPAFLP